MTLSWDVNFYLSSTNTLSVYIRIAKFGLLGCYFSFESTEPFIKLNNIIRNQDRLGLSKSYEPNDFERS